MNHSARPFAVIGLLVASPVAAQTAAPTPAPAARTAETPDILQKAVNIPGANWSFYGPNQTSRGVKAADVPGGQAVRVTIAAKGANPWDVGADSPIQKPIAAGDTILVAAYLRAPTVKDDATTPITFLGAVDAAPPYTPLANTAIDVGKTWKLYYASGKAAKAFAPGAARVTLHLANAKQVIELGPVFVFDFGPGYDPAKLPKN